MNTPTVDHDAARRAVFWAKESDEREDRCWERDSQPSKLPALRRQFEAAKEIYGPFKIEPASMRAVGGEVVFTGEKFVRIGDADDSTPLASPYPAKEIRELKQLAKADREYLEHAEAETGMGAPPEEIARRAAEKTEIRRQSHELAKRLEAAGKPAYRSEAFSIWVYFVHTKAVEKVPNFRRVCLLPYVAAIVRAQKLAALEYFIDRNPFCRFWTFTGGLRVDLDGLRPRAEWIHRRLSQLNAWLRPRWGVELVFRSTEFGTLEFDATGKRLDNDGSIEFDDKGEPLFHVHAHCVVRPMNGTIPPEKWSKMIEEIWAFWGHHWDAGSIIRDARECCKYVTKPGDMLRLTPEQLGRMFDAVSRLKLCQPLGSLAQEIRARKKAGKTLRRQPTPDGFVWIERFDQNKWAEVDAADREQTWNFLDAQRMAEETAVAAKTKPGVTPRLREKDSAWCAVFARHSPAIGPAGLKEPRVVVGGTHFDAKRVEGHPLVRRLWEQTIDAWEAGRAISVHTGTPTVTNSRPFDFLPQLPERVAPPGEPVWAAAGEISS